MKNRCQPLFRHCSPPHSKERPGLFPLGIGSPRGKEFTIHCTGKKGIASRGREPQHPDAACPAA